MDERRYRVKLMIYKIIMGLGLFGLIMLIYITFSGYWILCHDSVIKCIWKRL